MNQYLEIHQMQSPQIVQQSPYINSDPAVINHGLEWVFFVNNLRSGCWIDLKGVINVEWLLLMEGGCSRVMFYQGRLKLVNVVGVLY